MKLILLLEGIVLHIVSGWRYAPGGGVIIDYAPGDLNNYLNQKGKFGTNDLVIYDHFI